MLYNSMDRFFSVRKKKSDCNGKLCMDFCEGRTSLLCKKNLSLEGFYLFLFIFINWEVENAFYNKILAILVI